MTVGNEVYIDLGDFYAGPYEVDFREITQSYYIRPQIKNSKYTISGYNKRNSSVTVLTDSDNYWGASENRWTVLSTKENAVAEQLDVITDAQLLESFRESVGVENIKDGRTNS